MSYETGNGAYKPSRTSTEEGIADIREVFNFKQKNNGS